MRNPGGEFHHFEPTRQGSFGICERLAVLLRDDPRKLLLVRVEKRATISTSRLTVAPGRRSLNIVTPSVCGIRFTAKRAPSTVFTVRLTPCTAIDPFGAMNRASSLGASTARYRLPDTSSVTARDS